jgi:S1-C subfamily serine protease
MLMPSQLGAQIVNVRLVWAGPANSSCDLAILKADINSNPAFVIAEDQDIKAGADVVTAGANGLAGGMLLNSSLKAGDPASGTPAVQSIFHSAPLAEGDSGGPLATRDGKLIGVEVLARAVLIGDSQGVALRPDLNWMRQMIEKDRAAHPPSTRPTTSTTGNNP